MNPRRAIAVGALLTGMACAPSESPAPAPPAPPAKVFYDRARETGLVFEHTNGMSGEFYIIEVIGSGGALFDYDNDGDLDVYLVQGEMLGPGKTWADATFPPAPDAVPGDRLFRNELTESNRLSFVEVTEQAALDEVGYGMGVVAADYDNDGWIDLYVTRLGSNSLLRNSGDGTFENVTEESGTDDRRWSVPAVFFDYDADGRLDLYVGNYVDFRYSTHKQCVPEQGFVDYCSPLAYHPEPDRLFRNLGDGTFEDATGPAGLAAAHGNTLGAIPADFDGDGRQDLYVANDWSENRLWINRGDGTFSEGALAAGCAVNAHGEPEASMGVVAADFDEDGDADLFMTHLQGETNTLYRNNGAGAFEDQSILSGLGTASREYTGWGTAAVDYDGDGWLDLFVANGGVRLIMNQVQVSDPLPFRQPDLLFRNDRGRSFTYVGELLESHLDVGRGVAAGDVDNDGDADLLLVNNQGPARLLLNEAPSPARWVGLRLVGLEGRDALGARVSFRFEDGTTRTHQVQTAGSYASSNDPRVLQVLEDGRQLAGVRVDWPDGSVGEWTDLEERRYSVLRQAGQ